MNIKRYQQIWLWQQKSRLGKDVRKRGEERKGEKGTVNQRRSCIIQPDEDNVPWFAHHFDGVSSSETATGDDAVPHVYVYPCEYAFKCPRVNVISATITWETRALACGIVNDVSAECRANLGRGLNDCWSRLGRIWGTASPSLNAAKSDAMWTNRCRSRRNSRNILTETHG